MAKDEKQSGVVLPNSSVILAALLASGTYWFAQDEPLRGSRPTAIDTQIQEQSGIQEIEARLWQDPIGAVAEWREKRAQRDPTPPCGKDPEDRRCKTPLGDDEENAQVLGVTMSGARYPQDSEYRRRTRYAVLAGLDRAGFVPVDSQHIDYFLFRPKRNVAPSSPHTVVPFEWFRSTDADHPEQRILAFWLDEDTLGSKPLTTFEELADFLRGQRGSPPRQGHETPRVTIIGPEWSGNLQAMAVEACGSPHTPDDCPQPIEQWPGLENVSFYTYSASAPDKQVLKSSPITGADVSTFFRRHGIAMHRILAPDDLLADSVVRELRRRGVAPAQTPEDHIALITEWDTLYGQTFPQTVKDAFWKSPDTAPEHTQCGPQVHDMRYLRGLDGQMPGAARKEGRGTDRESAQPDEQSANVRNNTQADTRNLERPNGQSQFDYLRRLAGRLHDIDECLRRRGEGSIKAIGVLGSDVFDKLLVLQALRARFPEALFFTTDLDLNLTLPDKLNWTRNLIISSSFDLQLGPDLQAQIPPFRSAFQTAVFLSTLVAVGDAAGTRKEGPAAIGGLLNDLRDKSDRWCLPARLFEIGRTGDLIAFEDLEENSERMHSSPPTCVTSNHAIHPPIPEHYPTLDRFSLPYFFAIAVLIVLFGLALRFATPLRRQAAYFLREAKTTTTMVCRGIVPIIGIVIIAIAATELVTAIWFHGAKALTDAGKGEPLTFLQGTSVWPTILLRVLGTCLSVWFIWRASKQLDTNLRDIAKDIRIGDDLDTETEAARRAEAKHSPWEKFSRMFSYVILRPSRRRDARSDHAGKRYNIGLAWRSYVYQERLAARLWRTTAWFGFSFMLVVVTLWENWTDLTRGSIARHAYLATTYLDLALVTILVIFVFDATLFFWFFVTEVRENTTEWPEDSKRFWEDRICVDPKFVDDLIDLEFMAKRTKCIADLIYYPFIVIGLTILSCSTTLAHFHPTLPFLVIQGASLLIVAGCAVALRMAAESARETVKGKLADEIARERDEQRAGKLRSLLHRVEYLHEGAFRPWSEQPVVRAALWPLGTFGAAWFLERLGPLGL